MFNDNNIKKAFLVILIIALSIPLMQETMNLSKERKLKGYYAKIERLPLSASNWFNGEFQSKRQDNYNQNFGFRSFFVRFYNQIQYSLFDKISSTGVIIGKDMFLFEYSYIDAACGKDFVGEKKIVTKVNKLQKVSDTLKSKGVTLMVVLTPGKGSFFSEHIPDNLVCSTKKTTNYKVYKDELEKHDIHFLDFYKWFFEMKNNSKHNLFPKTGIHWSEYGNFIAADSILGYIEKTKNTKIPRIISKEIQKSTVMRGRDNDIENGLNLIFGIDNLEMSYPIYKKNNATSDINVISIADSYYTEIFNLYLSNKTFNKRQFWYYYKNSFKNNTYEFDKIEDINRIEEVENSDVIILLATDANFSKFGFGFIEDMYDHYFVKPNKENNKKDLL